jgi:lysophospholipase L1-like esterase
VNSDRIYSVIIPMLRPMVTGRIGAGRRRHLDIVAVPPKRVVFLGDSITEGGLWSDLFPDLPTSNRGIGGEASYDVLERLDSAINDPVAVSLMIGTNDLHGPRKERDTAKIAGRTDEIIRRIHSLAPSAQVLVNSVLPRTAFFAAQITDLNERNRAAAARHGAAYIDLWPTFADAAGAIRPEYARDGLHLTPVGYLAWAAVLRPHLASFAIRGPA